MTCTINVDTNEHNALQTNSPVKIPKTPRQPTSSNANAPGSTQVPDMQRKNKCADKELKRSRSPFWKRKRKKKKHRTKNRIDGSHSNPPDHPVYGYEKPAPRVPNTYGQVQSVSALSLTKDAPPDRKRPEKKVQRTFNRHHLEKCAKSFRKFGPRSCCSPDTGAPRLREKIEQTRGTR